MKTIQIKKIHEIFSKKSPKKITQEEIGEIIADYREKNSLVPASLIKLGFKIKFQELKVADFIVKETAIERKTVSDFISSMINRRLIKQLEEIQQYSSKLLIIEGIEEKELYSDNQENKINPNAIRSFLLSIVLKHKIPIIFTKNAEDTARFISVLYKKSQGEASLNASKKSFSKKEQLQYILESFPGIGPKTAKKLLENFGNIKNIINSPLEELEKILGKKAENFKKIIENKY
jgi:ERCC4-type nuclease